MLLRRSLVARHHDLSPAVPARQNDDAVAVECIGLVDELRTCVVERAVWGGHK